MARLPRVFLPGTAQHIIQQGNNRQVCFASDEVHAAYVHWLAEASKKYRVAVNTGLAVGNNRFRDEIERSSGRRMRPLKRGPKPKAQPDGDDRKQEFLL